MSNEKRNRPDIRLRSRSYCYQRYCILSLPLIRHKTKIEWCNSSVSNLLERSLRLAAYATVSLGEERGSRIYISFYCSTLAEVARDTYPAARLCACLLLRRCVLQEDQNYEHWSQLLRAGSFYNPRPGFGVVAACSGSA